jgi:threonyl-tRNA synthetase
MDKQQHLENLRHSAAHLLAQAVLELFPDTKLTIGPTTETGFFYDFQPVVNFKEEDLPKIEARMHELAKKNYRIEGGQVPKDKARALYTHNRFKLELIDGIPGETVGIYSQGPFFDLCKGGHLDAIGEIKHFKLVSISGSYWRADRSGTALQRITGVCFETQEELDAYFKHLEEVKMYDHRKLGRELDLFSFHDEAAGMPFFHAKGTIVYNELIAYSRRLQKDDYQEIKTPLVMTEDLWKTSGHYDNYKDKMYFSEAEDVSYCVRPMNCPSSIMVYKERPHSYRELPKRIAEYGHVHRYELSGVLHGLFRVRAFTQDDAHIYCTQDQLEVEIMKCLELAEKIYNKFGFTDVKMAVSTRPSQSIGSDELWEKGIEVLVKAFHARGINFTLQEGEGAFYGPKIEIIIKDAMGREWQCGTVQVDFFLPERFDLEYVTADQSRQRPVIIHRAIYGSIERFFGILLEHYKGHLPFWLAPVQMRILTITDEQKDYAYNLAAQLRGEGFRVEVDHSGGQISAQIKKAQVEKLPWMLVLGKKEVQNNTVTLRHNDGRQEFGLSLEQLLEKARAEVS